ncbi:MAG: hypothetical protein OXF79_18540 [Chloroflexi bacterium]|nr:hypothetical protein [Chloroflexota bacterium]
MASQKYQRDSRHLLAQARGELTQGDLRQASEKGWGAAALMMKAIAEQRGWEHERHRHLTRAASHLRALTGDGDVMDHFARANLLHENYYEDTFSQADVAEGLDRVGLLLDKLEPLLSP